MSDFKEKVEQAIRRFCTPYAEDIRVSLVNDARWMDYVAGQALTTELINARAEIERLIETMQGNFCSVCWNKLEAEGTITQQMPPTNPREEIEKLKVMSESFRSILLKAVEGDSPSAIKTPYQEQWLEEARKALEGK